MMFPASYQILKLGCCDGLHDRGDLVRGAAAAAVRLHHQLDLPFLRVGRRIAHDLVVVLVLLRARSTPKVRRYVSARPLRVVDLLARFLDRFLERDVVPRTERGHVGRQPAGRDALLEAGEYSGVASAPMNGSVLRPREETCRLIARRLDLLQASS